MHAVMIIGSPGAVAVLILLRSPGAIRHSTHTADGPTVVDLRRRVRVCPVDARVENAHLKHMLC